MKRLTVVIPSKTRPSQADFLANAIASIRAQTAEREMAIEVVVGLDKDAVPPILSDQRNVIFVESASHGQAAALNAGAAKADADYIAFLEDDDQWHPNRVAFAMQALEHSAFVSSTQLEVDGSGQVCRINDFPTPSGWLMPMSSWRRIGPFNETFQWHLDNEWLGRLGESGLKRGHLVEATAPIHPAYVRRVRPWLWCCLQFGGPNVSLVRHTAFLPLVTRLVHANSGMATIALDVQANAVSKAEGQRLLARFGHKPW